MWEKAYWVEDFYWWSLICTCPAVSLIKCKRMVFDQNGLVTYIRSVMTRIVFHPIQPLRRKTLLLKVDKHFYFCHSFVCYRPKLLENMKLKFKDSKSAPILCKCIIVLGKFFLRKKRKTWISPHFFKPTFIFDINGVLTFLEIKIIEKVRVFLWENNYGENK